MSTCQCGADAEVTHCCSFTKAVTVGEPLLFVTTPSETALYAALTSSRAEVERLTEKLAAAEKLPMNWFETLDACRRRITELEGERDRLKAEIERLSKPKLPRYCRHCVFAEEFHPTPWGCSNFEPEQLT